MKKNNLLVLAGLGAVAYFIWKSKAVYATPTESDGKVGYTTPEGSVLMFENPTPGQATYEAARQSLVQQSSKLQGGIKAKEALEWWRANPSVSWEQLQYAVVSSSKEALATEARIYNEQATGQITVKPSTYTTISKSQSSALNQISNQGGLAQSFANQVKNQGSMTAMDKQILKNYQAKVK